MRLNEDYIENIDQEEIKLEEPKISIKSADEYHFSLYVTNTSVMKWNADERLKKLSKALDYFPNIYQHAEEYRTDDSDDVNFLIGLAHNIRKPAEVFRLLCMFQKILSRKDDTMFTIQAQSNPWTAYIRDFNLLHEYHDEGLNIGVTGFAHFMEMVAVFNNCERDVFDACITFMNFDWPDAIKRGVVYHLDRNKANYLCLEDVRFDKTDLKGRISLEQLNSIQSIDLRFENMDLYNLFFMEVEPKAQAYHLDNFKDYMKKYESRMTDKDEFFNITEVWEGFDKKYEYGRSALMLYLGTFYSESSLKNTGYMLVISSTKGTINKIKKLLH